MKKIHKLWSENLMGTEPGIDGKTRIEIDESEIIALGNSVRWMFGLVDRNNYDIRIFFVNDNRQKEILLLIIKNIFIVIMIIYPKIKMKMSFILLREFTRTPFHQTRYQILIILPIYFIRLITRYGLELVNFIQIPLKVFGVKLNVSQIILID